MDEYLKLVEEISKDVCRQERREKWIGLAKENAWDIVKGVIIIVIGALVLSLFQ